MSAQRVFIYKYFVRDKLNILLVEDDPNDVFLIEHALRKAGVPKPIAIATDGEQAIAYLSGAGKYSDRAKYPLPDCLITDLKMPKKNGFDVLQWIGTNNECRRIPAMVLTASQQPEDIQRAYCLGTTAFFVKPVRIEEMEHLIKSLVDFWRLSLPRPI